MQGEWKCPVCAHDNSLSRSRCEVCKAPQPSPSLAGQPSPSPSPSVRARLAPSAQPVLPPSSHSSAASADAVPAAGGVLVSPPPPLEPSASLTDGDAVSSPPALAAALVQGQTAAQEMTGSCAALRLSRSTAAVPASSAALPVERPASAGPTAPPSAAASAPPMRDAAAPASHASLNGHRQLSTARSSAAPRDGAQRARDGRSQPQQRQAVRVKVEPGLPPPPAAAPSTISEPPASPASSVSSTVSSLFSQPAPASSPRTLLSPIAVPPSPAASPSPASSRRAASQVTTLFLRDKGREKIVTTLSIDAPFTIPSKLVVEMIPISRAFRLGSLPFVLGRFSVPTVETEQEQMRQAKEYQRFFHHLSSAASSRVKMAKGLLTADGQRINVYLFGPERDAADAFSSTDTVRCFYKVTGSSKSGSPRSPASPSTATPHPMQQQQQQLYAHNSNGSGSMQQPPSPYGASPFWSISSAHPPPPPSASHPGPYSSPPLARPSHFQYPPLYSSSSFPAPAPPSATAAVVEQPARAIISPAFLRDLTHQHDWVFGAVAELIHNSRDAGASRISVSIRHQPASPLPPILIVDDDGSGMSHEELRLMLSFGSDQRRQLARDRIGKFGFGFKHGSMRIGDDALVLTKSEKTFSVGFLSQSYNATQTELRTPIITRNRWTRELELDKNSAASTAEAERAITQHSPFNHIMIGEEIGSMAEHGTRILIFNLRLDGSAADGDEDRWELKWRRPSNDIRIVISPTVNMQTRPGQMSKDVPLDYSLRAYCELMFLDGKSEIALQGQRVTLPFNPEKQLRQVQRIVCPSGAFAGRTLTIGFNAVERSRGNCGVHLYWHSALIEGYRRVGPQLSSDRGLGVIGVFDVGDALEPKNTKQAFPASSARYQQLLAWLGQQLTSYVFEQLREDVVEVVQGSGLQPELHWVQCDACNKWRRVTLEEKVEYDAPERRFFCYLNRDRRYSTCDAAEEKSDSREVTVSVSAGGVQRTLAVAAADSNKPAVAATDSNKRKREDGSQAEERNGRGQQQQQQQEQAAAETERERKRKLDAETEKPRQVKAGGTGSAAREGGGRQREEGRRRVVTLAQSSRLRLSQPAEAGTASVGAVRAGSSGSSAPAATGGGAAAAAAAAAAGAVAQPRWQHFNAGESEEGD